MGSVTRYAALSTKTRALEKKMLTSDDYEALINAEDAASVLKYIRTKTDYGQNEVMSFSGATPTEIERSLREYIFDRYAQMVHFLSNEDRKFFNALLVRHEIETLKRTIRAVYSGLHKYIELPSYHNYFIIKDFSALTNCSNLQCIVNKLNGTPYGDILKPYINENQHRLIFYVEMALDRYYFEQLMRSVEKINREDRAFMKQAIGQNIDFLNIQWLYRAQHFYKLGAEERFNYCLPGGANLGLKRLKTLCYLEDAQAFIKALEKTAYKKVFEHIETVDINLERDMARVLYNIFKVHFRASSSTLSAPIGYLHRLEFEIRDIFAILEAKSYNMDAEKTKKFLVREIG